MPLIGRTLFFLLLACGSTFLGAQSAQPTIQAQRQALPGLQGPARLAALLKLANSLEAKAPQEALTYTDEGIALARSLGDREREAAFLSTTAYCCSQTGDFSRSIDFGRRALALGTEIGNQDRIAKAHNALGITYTFVGAYSQALEESVEALRIREELGEVQPIAQSLNLIGVVYHHSGQYEKAIDYFNQVLKRTEATSDPKRKILAKLNIGFALFKLGRFKEALQIHQEALAMTGQFNETTHLNYAHLNLGMTYTDLGQYAQAGQYLQMAHDEYRKQDQKHGLVQALNALARLQLLTGNFARGIPLAKEAALLAQKINARDELKASYELISDLYGKLHNTEESYRYFKLATATKDSIFTAQESNRISEISMKLVTMRKDNEIDKLKKERIISALQIKEQRYLSIVFISSIGFLVVLVLTLATYNKKMRLSRTSLEKSNSDLAQINTELQDKIHEIKTLSGLLPICAQCKKIRNDEGYWTQLEGYISEHTSATFSHGICPHCAEQLYPKAMEQLRFKDGPTDSELA